MRTQITQKRLENIEDRFTLYAGMVYKLNELNTEFDKHNQRVIDNLVTDPKNNPEWNNTIYHVKQDESDFTDSLERALYLSKDELKTAFQDMVKDGTDSRNTGCSLAYVAKPEHIDDFMDMLTDTIGSLSAKGYIPESKNRPWVIRETIINNVFVFEDMKWEVYKEDTCYDLTRGELTFMSDPNIRGYDITEFDDYDWSDYMTPTVDTPLSDSEEDMNKEKD